MINITDNDIASSEKNILPEDCHFSEEAKSAIKELNSCDILACPGAGKTTMLIAKIDILANKMPFINNRGMCILSHTNVAIDEIKSKLSSKASVILSYPNFVGTIQSFIHKFIVFPYLTNVTSHPITVCDSNKYNDDLYELYQNQSIPLYNLRPFVHRSAQTGGYNGDEKKFLLDLYINSETNDLMQNGRLISNSTSKSCNEFIRLKSYLWANGNINYYDAYYFAIRALNEYPCFTTIISKRFYISLVDEYQDCNKLQVQLLDKIFKNSQTIFQRIGDTDQAIYNSYNDEQSEWNLFENKLYLSNTNRFSQIIANQVAKLKSEPNVINSDVVTEPVLKPHIIVYDDNKIKEVLPRFCSLIIEKRLNQNKNPIFKAVGMIKKDGSGIQIGDYWNEFEKNSIQNKKTLYLDDYINQIYVMINNNRMDKMIQLVDSIYLECFNRCGKKDSNNRKYTPKSLSIFLKGLNNYYYKDFLLELSNIVFKDIEQKSQLENLKLKIKNKILELDFINYEQIKSFIEFENQAQDEEILNSHNNFYTFVDGEEKVELEVTTVHAVKGETHTATLYLETSYKSGTDIKRVLPLFKEEKLPIGDVHEKSRKIVYVGISRPKYLLCIAMKRTTYDLYAPHLNADAWEIIEL